MQGGAACLELRAGEQEGLTPVQTCRRVARPPRGSPGRRWHLQQQMTENMGEPFPHPLLASLSRIWRRSHPCRRPKSFKNTLTAPSRILEKNGRKALWENKLSFLSPPPRPRFFLFSFLFMATPEAYGGSQVRGQIRTIAAGSSGRGAVANKSD